MKRNLIYLTLAFLMGCVGFSSASHTYAYTLQELSVNNYGGNGIFGYCLNNDCYGQVVSNWCYNRIDYQGNRFYNTNTNSCASPTVSYGFNWYPDYGGSPYDMFEAYIDIPNGPSYQIPGVSFGNDGEGGLKFGFLRSSEGIVYYTTSSNTAFTLDYQGATHTITNAFFSPSSIVFYSNDGFFYQVSAGGYIGDGFFAINPNLSTDNVFFVRPSINKAWSYTFSQSDAWLYLLGEYAIPSIQDIPFDKSYTLTRGGSSFYPTNFYTYPQTSNDDGIIYSLDLEFSDIPSIDNNDAPTTGGTISYSKDYLSCVQYYTQLDNLNTFYSRCGSDWRNGLLTGSSSDQLANMTALSNYFENPSSGYNGTSFDNYNCDGTITVISGLNNLYGSNWSVVLDDYSMIGVSGNFNASTFCNGAINDNSWVSMHNMIDYLAINGTGAVDCDAIDNLFDRLECQLGIGQYTSTQFDSIFDKFVGLIGIVVDKFFNLIEDGFNTGYHISGDSSWLSCSNSSVEIPYIDYVQYIALFFIILFFIKLI